MQEREKKSPRRRGRKSQGRERKSASGSETELSLFETDFLFFPGCDPVSFLAENRSAHDPKVSKKICMSVPDNMQKCSVNDFTFPSVKEGEGRKNFSPGSFRRREENLPG